MLRALLRNAVARKEPGVNVLLYGPPGTGKTELAKVVAQAAGLELFEVEYADRDGNSLSGRDRYRSLQIAQVFLKGSAQAALLFDEVEDVFPPISSEAAQLMARAEHGGGAASGSVSGKAWVNQILETNPVPTHLGHQPHRADRPGVPPPLRRTTWSSSRRRPARARRWCARRCDGVAVSRGLRRPSSPSARA